jgi:excisionase family DNA binding protein
MQETQSLPIMATIKQASKQTGISEWSIRYLAKQRKIKAFNSGRKIFVNLSSLLNFLEQSEVGNDWGEGNG